MNVCISIKKDIKKHTYIYTFLNSFLFIKYFPKVLQLHGNTRNKTSYTLILHLYYNILNICYNCMSLDSQITNELAKI